VDARAGALPPLYEQNPQRKFFLPASEYERDDQLLALDTLKPPSNRFPNTRSRRMNA